MIAQREASVALAERTSARLRDLFDDAGTTSRPGGWLVSSYRRLTQALRGRTGDARFAIGLLDDYERLLASRFEESLDDASDIGQAQAREELAVWGFGDVIRAAGTALFVASAVDALLSIWRAQAAKARALIATGRADDVVLFGDGGRVGILTPGRLVLEHSDWTVRAAVTAHAETALATVARAIDAGAVPEPLRGIQVRDADSQGVTRRTLFDRQAVAAIDERTTDCCLDVHGQVVPLDGLYILTGTPRYGDKWPAPPFHWYCRTAQALVPIGQGDDVMTRRMRAAAAAEKAARARTGIRVEIHPANAFSGRAG